MALCSASNLAKVVKIVRTKVDLNFYTDVNRRALTIELHLPSLIQEKKIENIPLECWKRLLSMWEGSWRVCGTNVLAGFSGGIPPAPLTEIQI